MYQDSINCGEQVEGVLGRGEVLAVSSVSATLTALRVADVFMSKEIIVIGGLK